MVRPPAVCSSRADGSPSASRAPPASRRGARPRARQYTRRLPAFSTDRECCRPVASYEKPAFQSPGGVASQDGHPDQKDTSLVYFRKRIPIARSHIPPICLECKLAWGLCADLLLGGRPLVPRTGMRNGIQGSPVLPMPPGLRASAGRRKVSCYLLRLGAACIDSLAETGPIPRTADTPRKAGVRLPFRSHGGILSGKGGCLAPTYSRHISPSTLGLQGES